ncbi:MAG: hypothetical protein JNK23_01275 [Opitutaceae bacterium]|nr:hypothetical protein [Opitutaceae bacterium]
MISLLSDLLYEKRTEMTSHIRFPLAQEDLLIGKFNTWQMASSDLLHRPTGLAATALDNVLS